MGPTLVTNYADSQTAGVFAYPLADLGPLAACTAAYASALALHALARMMEER